ncbi:MAG: hypothetical protein Rpha_1686 [Candidatus Ruthia sp. Apha_13_S6]|nr:hypothetical protein [Candidatus Ruthia sp. Apha_13_S6]
MAKSTQILTLQTSARHLKEFYKKNPVIGVFYALTMGHP